MELCMCNGMAILKKSADVIGFTKKINKDWFDEHDREIQNLLTEKRAVFQGQLAQPISRKEGYF